MKRLLFMLAALSNLAIARNPSPVVFESFEYRGRDPQFEAPLAPGEYQNPILAGFYSDPSICRVDDDYYLINSTFAYFPGIPIFHSRDLVQWTQLGHVIDRPAQLKYDGLGVSRGIFAPAINHHDGTFYVVCTMVDAGGNFLVTAKNPAGPWSDPIWLGFDGIDPSLFFDDTGRAWLVNNGEPPEGRPLYSGHRAIWLQEFDLASKKLIGPRKIIVNGGVDLSKKPVWIEGPHLYKRDGWYYLCCAEGGTGDQHTQVILRSRDVTGPYLPWEKNPILTQRDLDASASGVVTSTGHADLVVGPDGNWWSVFLGCRPFEGTFYATGRETFLLPVTWTDDGWPLILKPGARVPLRGVAPKVGARGDPVKGRLNAAPPLTGNFVDRDEFTDSQISLRWLQLRAPHEKLWQLDPAAGHLLMTPQVDTLSGNGEPSYLGRRLQHQYFDAITQLAPPKESGISAGIVVFQSENHHFYLGVRRDGEHLLVFLERSDGGALAVVASATVQVDSKALRLKISGEQTTLAFAYSTTAVGDDWRALSASEDARIITTEAAGGFVGATVGMHARVEK